MVSIAVPPTSEHPEADAAVGEVMHGVDQVEQVSTESVKFPHHERVALSERLQSGRQVRPVISLTRGMVLVEVVRLAPATRSESC